MKLISFITSYTNPLTKEIDRGFYKEHYYKTYRPKKIGPYFYQIFDSRDRMITQLPIENTIITIINYE